LPGATATYQRGAVSWGEGDDVSAGDDDGAVGLDLPLAVERVWTNSLLFILKSK
jgi:hypothetical protein